MNEVAIYNADGLEDFSVLIKDETVWLTQAQMSELFQTTRNNVTMHISNVFKDNELLKYSVCKDFLHTAADGKNYKTKYYNLDVIISVGYRVKSLRGTQFRQWATRVLKEHFLKGYTVKQPISIEQLNGIKDEVQGLANEVNEMLQRQDKSDLFVYEEFGKVYEIINKFFEQKKLQDKKPHRQIGFRISNE